MDILESDNFIKNNLRLISGVDNITQKLGPDPGIAQGSKSMNLLIFRYFSLIEIQSFFFELNAIV